MKLQNYQYMWIPCFFFKSLDLTCLLYVGNKDKLLPWLNGFTMLYEWSSCRYFITKSVQKSTPRTQVITFHCHAAFLDQSICSHQFPTRSQQIRTHTIVHTIRPHQFKISLLYVFQQPYVNRWWLSKNSVSKSQMSLSHFVCKIWVNCLRR